jgi:hypothetical protein
MRFEFGTKGRWYINGTEFVASDQDTANAVKYWGFVSYEGPWMIMKQDDTDPNNTTYRFACGRSAYSVAYIGRAGLTYTTYDALVASF